MIEKITKDKGGFKSRPVHHNRTPSQNKIFDVLWNLKQNGYADETIKGYSKRLKHLEQNTNINNPQTVKGYIARMNVSNAYKEAMVNAYIHYVEPKRP